MLFFSLQSVCFFPEWQDPFCASTRLTSLTWRKDSRHLFSKPDVVMFNINYLELENQLMLHLNNGFIFNVNQSILSSIWILKMSWRPLSFSLFCQFVLVCIKGGTIPFLFFFILLKKSWNVLTCEEISRHHIFVRFKI